MDWWQQAGETEGSLICGHVARTAPDGDRAERRNVMKALTYVCFGATLIIEVLTLSAIGFAPSYATMAAVVGVPMMATTGLGGTLLAANEVYPFSRG